MKGKMLNGSIIWVATQTVLKLQSFKSGKVSRVIFVLQYMTLFPDEGAKSHVKAAHVLPEWVYSPM